MLRHSGHGFRGCSIAVCAVATLLGGLAGCADTGEFVPDPQRRVLIMVWDGLRPDSINPADTPNLHALRAGGVDFTDNHATYPTFTMMNAATFASGGFPDATGYYGNVVWQPGAGGNDAANHPVDFRQPVFTEDYAILQDLTTYLRGNLLLVETLFEAAQKAGMVTATVGKTGAAYIQDYKRGGLMLDERAVLPLDLAKELQAAGYPLPAMAGNAFAPGQLTLAADNGNPTAQRSIKRLKDGATTDAADTSGGHNTAALRYLVDAYLNHILPQRSPRLTVMWLREPDTMQHYYGPGSHNARDALHATDVLLGQVQAKLRELGLDTVTDIIVVSDHGHSHVAGPSRLFPLRTIADGQIGAADPANGYSVSGLVRLADLMQRAGFTVFDGFGCGLLPVAMGVKADGKPVYPLQTDADGKICGKAGQKYTTPAFKVPADLPPKSVVIAVNGGSDYLYVPDRDAETVRRAVAFLQSRTEIGAVFVDSRYGSLPGTLPLNLIRVENTAGRNPDIIASFDYDENAVIGGVGGTEYAGSLFNLSFRGMHGSFSPIDVHNTLIANGPDFRSGFKDTLPSGNVDVAPTVARVLGLALPRADGRPLLEALRNGPPTSDYQVAPRTMHPTGPATGLTFKLPTDPAGNDTDPGKSSYSITLQAKALRHQGKIYTYFDYAKAVRQ